MIRAIVCAASIFLAAGTSATAAECPVEGVEAIENALKSADTCAAAVKVFKACGYGSTVDVQFGGIVIEKCEAAFLPGLRGSQRASYARGQKACGRKYAGRSGTMYRSATAFCFAELAGNYARRFGKERAPAGARK